MWEQEEATGRWQIAHDRWHTGIVDADSTVGLLAHIDGRSAATVAEWLRAHPDSSRRRRLLTAHEWLPPASFAKLCGTP